MKIEDIEIPILRKSLEVDLNSKFVFKPYLLFSIPVILFILFGIDKIPYEWYNITLGGMGIIYLIATKYVSPFKKKQLSLISKEIIGKIEIKDEKLKICTDSMMIELEKGSTDKLQFYYDSTFNTYNGPRLITKEKHYGTDNMIKLSNKVQFQIFIEDNSEKEKFYKISKWAQENLINAEEFTKKQRTYFGKQLKYEEIQEMKTISNNK